MQDQPMHRAAIFICLALCLPMQAMADPILPGAYDVDVEIRIPNVDVSNADFTTRICLRNQADLTKKLGPLGPGPLKDCPGVARTDGSSLIIDTKCDGPNAGWAVSTYVVTSRGFKGTVNLNMGGKNMTVQEAQRGTWAGKCE